MPHLKKKLFGTTDEMVSFSGEKSESERILFLRMFSHTFGGNYRAVLTPIDPDPYPKYGS
jgi:hypothetical protein